MSDLIVEIQNINPVKKMLTVEVSKEAMQNEVEEAYLNLAKTAKIAGFRQGKIPRDVLRQKYEGRILSEAATAIIQKTFPEALKQNKLMPIARPDFQVKTIGDNAPLIYTGIIEVVPEVDIKGYKDLMFARISTEVSNAEIDTNLTKLCDTHAEFKPVDRAAEEGDMAMIDFQGFIDGKPIKDGNAKDSPVVVGDNLLPGFDEVLEGASAGDEFVVETSFPDKYHVAALKGKPATFNVQVKGVRVRVVPPLDKELAKLFGLKNAAELKAKVTEEITTTKIDNEKERLRGLAVDELIGINQFEIPDSMKARYFEGILKTVDNMSKEDQGGFKKPEMTPDLKGKYKEIAEIHAKRDLIIEAVATKEKFDATDEEIEAAVEKISKQSGDDFDRTMAKIQREGSLDSIRTGIRHEKVFDLLLENTMKEEPKKSKATEADEAGE